MQTESDSFQEQIAEIERRTPFVDSSKFTTFMAHTPMPSVIEDTSREVADPKPQDKEAKPKSRIASNHGHVASDQAELSNPADVVEKSRIVNDSLKITPIQERPRERMHQLGPAGITTTELLAIVLRSGIRGKNVKKIADDLLNHFDGLQGLSRVSTFNMRKVEGISEVKADVLTAAFELGRRAALEEIELSADGYGKIMPNGEAIAWTMAKHFTSLLRDNRQEEMWIAFLDVRNRFRGKTRIYIGCCDQLVAKTGEILSRVIERNFPRYALVHNHPSGQGDPSGADISFTERLVQAGHLLDIELVDHVVLGENMQSCVSMKQRKLVDFEPLSRANIKLSEVSDDDPNPSI